MNKQSKLNIIFVVAIILLVVVVFNLNHELKLTNHILEDMHMNSVLSLRSDTLKALEIGKKMDLSDYKNEFMLIKFHLENANDEWYRISAYQNHESIVKSTTNIEMQRLYSDFILVAEDMHATMNSNRVLFNESAEMYVEDLTTLNEYLGIFGHEQLTEKSLEEMDHDEVVALADLIRSKVYLSIQNNKTKKTYN